MKNIITKQIDKSLYREILIYGSGLVLLFACSQINIPLDPVPITMHSVGVMLIALLYNMKRGLISYFLYLTLGSLGLPMFSSYSSGLNIIFGSCFGYFIGFGLAIYLMNLIKIKIGMDSFAKIALNCALGTLVLYSCGILWLSITLGFKQAVIVGLIPFIVPGIIKTIALAGMLRILKISK